MQIQVRYIVGVFLVLAALAAFTNAFGQSAGERKRVDSLLTVLKTSAEDTAKATLQYSLSRAYRHLSPDSGLMYGAQSLALSRKLNYPRGQAYAYLAMAQNQYNKAMNFYYDPKDFSAKEDYGLIWEYATAAEKLFDNTGNKRGLASALGMISNLYLDQGDYKRSIEYRLRTISLYEELGEGATLYDDWGGIGNAYNRMGKYAMSVACYTRAIELAKRAGQQNLVTGFVRNIGDVYTDSGALDVARMYYDSSFRMAQRLTDVYGAKAFSAIVLMNIASTYIAGKNFAAAIEYARKALAIDEEIGRENGIATALYTIGDQYLAAAGKPGENRHIESAVPLLERSMSLATKLNMKTLARDCSYALARAYKLSGSHRKALLAYEQHVALKDSLHSEEERTDIQKRQMRYEQEKQIAIRRQAEAQKEVIAQARLSKEKNLRRTSVGIAMLLLVVALVTAAAYRQKQKDNVAIAREKKRSDELLLNILPPVVAAELKESGTAKAQRFDSVSVMFTDFVDFTQASEAMSPEELVTELDACFRGFDAIAEEYGLEKIKTIGDAYLAVCGAPYPNADHANTMVRAALAIRNFMDDRRRTYGSRTFEVRIGINSGSVLAGIVGAKKFAYDIWGDTVNTAARMEQSGVPGKVNISEHTYSLVRGQFSCTYRGEVAAKHKGNMKMYLIEEGNA